jgi:hypothetical protein
MRSYVQEYYELLNRLLGLQICDLFCQEFFIF